jgi:hypothetical protein
VGGSEILTSRASPDPSLSQDPPVSSDMLGMERRQSVRLPADESIVLTCLPSDPQCVPSDPCAAQILERSEKGLKVATRGPIAPSTLVRLDVGDSLILGEVAWCAKAGSRYHLGIQMEQSLQHMGDLRRLVASLLGQDERRPLHQSEAVEASRD